MYSGFLFLTKVLILFVYWKMSRNSGLSSTVEYLLGTSSWHQEDMKLTRASVAPLSG